MVLNDVHRGQVLLERLAVDVFRQNVRRVGRAWNFAEGKIFLSQAVLYPEVSAMQMADFAEAAALADAHRGGGISVDVDGKVQAKVSRQRL